MLSSFLAFALRQRVLVVVMACILIVGGIYAFHTIAIDAFPDVTTVLVQVVTKVPGMSPAEVERFVTFPMELQLMGAPGLTDIRSFSKVGLSMITVVFKDDIDIYLARQVVLERVLEVQELLPPGSRIAIGAQHDGIGRSLSVLSGGAPRQRPRLCHDRYGPDGAEDTRGLGDPAAAQGTARCRGCQFAGRICQAVPSDRRAGLFENMAWPYTMSSTPSPRIMPMPAAISSRRTTKSTWFAAWG